jgi:adenine-specific DNA-methyltransferase
MSRKQKLELTWIGKDERPRLEPRILIEQPEHSFHASVRIENDKFDNLLIQGDNLLALKALERDFSDKIKCIYIDPPFNTQQAFANYDDGVEHSVWLSLMRDRLIALRTLLSKDGTIFIHIDDNELAYLTVLADEVFGRPNRRYIITFRQASATGHKAINPGCVSITNYILIYAKNSDLWKPNRVFTDRTRDVRYNQFIENRDEDYSQWRICPLTKAFADHNGLPLREARKLIKESPQALDRFVIDQAASVVQMARPDYDSVSKEARAVIDKSEQEPERIFRLGREGYSDLYIKNGQRILFYSSKLKNIDGVLVAGEPLTTLWDDILSNNIHKEGGVDFPKGKKPEALLKRCIDLSTSEGDWVLDSFAGSGTSGAVAHKMGRRWILVEQGDQAITHCVPRLKRVIGGTDAEGITKNVEWKGGGGFRFYRLAPSLLERDKYGNWIVSKEYNPAMLAEAVCKHMGFTYAPSQDSAEYWNHGFSSERDFIYITTQAITHGMMAALSNDVGPDRHLLICCKAYSGKPDTFENLTIRKIPHAILSNCEWRRDDYSLRIAALPVVESSNGNGDADGMEIAETPATIAQRGRKRRTSAPLEERSLFDTPAKSEA